MIVEDSRTPPGQAEEDEPRKRMMEFETKMRTAYWASVVRRPKVLVGLLSVLFFSLAMNASLKKSPGYDEPFHIASGLLYIESGRIVRAPDHPPLAREVAGLILHAVGVRLPQTVETQAVLAGEGGDHEYPIGDAVIAENGPGRVLFWARLPFLCMGMAFIGVMYFFGRALFGEAAGVAAALVCVFDPILLANFGLVYTDAGVAFFTVLTMLALWRFVQRPSWWRILWTGLALGAALGTKYSAVVLVPAIALLLLAAWFWPIAQEQGLPKSQARTTAWAQNYVVAFFAMCAVAMSVLLYVFLWPRDPGFYLTGMRQVNANHNPGWLYYLAGTYAKHFNRYYVEAWLLKAPIASIALTLVGAIAIGRRAKTPRLAWLFLVVPAGLYLLGYSLFSDDLGVRYVLPVLPFSLVAAALGLLTLWSGTRWMRIAAGAAVVWLGAAMVGVHPDEGSYFNESACVLTRPSSVGADGGTACGFEWLDDSNIDNGEGLKELRAWLDQHADGRRVYLGLAGRFPASVYGLSPQSDDYAAVLAGSSPGLYAVSAQILARAHPGPGYMGGAWLLQAKPIAFVGHTYFVYEVDSHEK